MKHNSPLVTALLLGAMATPATAQEAILLDEIVVSGALEPTAADAIGATLSVITAEQIEASGAVRLIDVLTRVPGINVTPRGPQGGLSGITIRGTSQNYVTVLIDGIDVSDVSGPQVAFDFGSLGVADISRIEILRGTQSALYGSEAVGGVISITTRRAEVPGISQSAGLEVGSYDTLRTSYGLTARQEGYEFGATLSFVTTEGFSAADEDAGNTEADGFTSTRLSLSGRFDVSDALTLGLSAFAESLTADFDEGFPLADGSPDEETQNDVLGLRVFAEFDAGRVSNTLSLSYYDITRDVTGSTSFGGANNLFEGTRTAAAYLGALDLGATGRLRFGADVTREEFTQSGDFGPGAGENTVVGIFTEYAFAPSDRSDLIATLRYDDHSRFGGYLSGRLAGTWRASPDLTFRGAVATGFRAPSNYELFGPFGEPTLEPEESLSVDLGVERSFGPRSLLRATLFYSETTNLIDFPFPYAQVPGTVTRQGVELEGVFGLTDRLDLTAAYTYTDADNPPLTAGNTWNTSFGRHDLFVGLDARLTDRLSGSVSVQHVADRQVLPDYTVIGASVTYALSDGVDAYFRIENLADESYQLFSGYGTSDRAFFAGFRATF